MSMTERPWYAGSDSVHLGSDPRSTWDKLLSAAYVLNNSILITIHVTKSSWRLIKNAGLPSFWKEPSGCRSAAAAAAKLLQSCLTPCDSIDGSPPGFPVPGILQARTLEWVAISFSNAWKWKVKVKLPSHVPLLATPWTAAYHAPPSVGFSRQEYWSGLPLPSPQL